MISAKKRKAVLSEIAQNAAKDSDRIKAIDVLNKMDGQYVTKVEGSVSAGFENPFSGLTTEELKKLAGE